MSTNDSLLARWVPSRPLSITVFVVWLLLVGSVSPGNLLLGIVFAIVLPLAGDRLRPKRARLRRPLVALRLGGTVLWDIVVSNIEVAKLILGPQKKLTPEWLWVPLDIANDHGIATLAGIITMTPGTLSADLTADGRFLLVHCLNLKDPAEATAQIKRRYEAPLMEIFQ